MAVRNRNKDDEKMSDDCLSSTISSSTLEIVLDDRSASDSGDEYSNDQPRRSAAGTTGSENSTYRRKKQIPIRDPKSHRLIEKRRRDRMNACLNELLQLTPHEAPETQRRIEKTEIIEMAIKHMRYLIGTLDKKCKLDKSIDSNIDSYRTGYRNALSDIFEFLHEYLDIDELLTELTKYLREKDIDLDSLTVMPDKKRAKYLTISDKPTQSICNKSITKSTKDDDKLCVISHVEEYKQSDNQSLNIERQSSNHQSDSNVKVPIFVLHPSGTHYIPMCIDSSIVSHAFKKPSSNLSCTSSTTEQAQCHPVSIPVNFNPISTYTDEYELDIQNINVIGTRHQTSVRPN